MEELYELLESKLREIIEKKKEIEIRDIKDAAVILRELKDMEAPEEPEGAQAAWWSWGPCGRSPAAGRTRRTAGAGRTREERAGRETPSRPGKSRGKTRNVSRQKRGRDAETGHRAEARRERRGGLQA